MNIPTLGQSISYEDILEALDKGLHRKAALLLRNQAENFAQLVKRSKVDSGVLRRELEVARNVQKASLPADCPAIPGVTCATLYKPVHSLGGDYYDFLALQDGAWGIAIGDVSGKGIGAALVVATLQASLRAQTLRPRSRIETLMKNVNRLVRESSPAEFFASLFYAEYRPASRLLRYVNAGHNPPLVIRRSHGQCETFFLAPGGAPVGALEDSRYTSATFQLELGDVLVAYTDGVTEAENSDGDDFGQDRLERILCSCSAREPQEILHYILRELRAHSQLESQTDDITLVVMRVERVTETPYRMTSAPKEFRAIRSPMREMNTTQDLRCDILTL